MVYVGMQFWLLSGAPFQVYVLTRQITFVATCYSIQMEKCVGGHYVVSVATVGGVRLTYVIS